MAKKDKDTIYAEFLAELKALNPAIEEVLKDEKVSSKLRDGVLARADYSASMDDLKAQREQFATEVQAAREKIAGWQDWYGKTTQQFSATQEELAKYKEEFGDLTEGQQKKVAAQMGMTPEQVTQALNQELQVREQAYLKFADDLTDLKIEHREKFKEKLDTEAVFKIAGEKQLPLDVAYSVYIADRVEELRQADVKEQIAKAKEEGAREYATKHNLPLVPNNPDVVHVLDVQQPGKTQKDRVSAALADFMSRGRT